MLNFISNVTDKWSPVERLKLYRSFLGLTQTELAAKMGTTQTSVGRWESGTAPISLVTMSHVRRLVEVQIMTAAHALLFLLWQGLKGCSEGSVGGTPHTDFKEDCGGKLYLGAYFIDGYHKHTIHIRIDDRLWYALDQNGHATQVDEQFIRSVALALKA